MDRGNTLLTKMQTQCARLLSRGPASSLILAGTLAFAGFGAAVIDSTPGGTSAPVVMSIPSQPAPTYLGGHCHPDPDGDGHTVCHVPANQLSNYPNSACFSDPDGDGSFVCYLDTH